MDDRQYSPTLLFRILKMAGRSRSFEDAADALETCGELNISSKHIRNLVVHVGQEMAQERDERTKRYVNQPLPRRPTPVDQPPNVAVVFLDGGRIQTREPGQGSGVHEPHWRETKNAAFHRMASEPLAEDPHPLLPACFADKSYVKKLVKGLKSYKKTEGKEGAEEALAPCEELALVEHEKQSLRWQPKSLFVTCLSSMTNSDSFGEMMAAQADERGFFEAQRKGFVADGQAYNWTIWERWFGDFTAIADFVHVVEYLYDAARAVESDDDAKWRRYVRWASACWQSRVVEVLEEMRQEQAKQPACEEGEKLSASDPRQVLSTAITYLTNNTSRMDYVTYRCTGLPTTSSLVESLVKQISYRVKGTEKFWDDGEPAEAILQIRAAVLSEGERLQRWIANRPISPFSSRCQDERQQLNK